MSQLPPDPRYGQEPPDDPYYAIPQRQQTNVYSVISLICGLAMCIPIATGLAAIILGIMGIRRSRDPRFGGRSMAVAGLILGILSVLGWIIISAIAYTGYQRVRPGLELTDAYLQDLASGDVAAANARSAENLSSQQIAQLSAQVQELGPSRGFSPSNFAYHSDQAGERWQFIGRARFGETDRPVTITIIRVDGQWKVSQLTIGDSTIE
jgi:hypothetical protein